ncbi:sirohydrochlorin chelatase [Agromyces soli]
MTSPALVAVSHGTSSTDGRAAVRGLVRAVGSRLMGGEADASAIRLGHVDVEQPDVPTTLASLPADAPAVVVPLLLSAGYHVHVDLAEAVAEAAGPAGDGPGRRVVLAGAMGPDDRLVAVLARRLAEAGWNAGDAVVLAVAGSSDARAVADCQAMGVRLGAVLGRRVTVGYLSAAEPSLADAVAAAASAEPGRRVVVSSYLLAPGYFQDLAVAEATGAGADLVTEPLLLPGVQAPAELAALVIDRFAEASAALPSVE